MGSGAKERTKLLLIEDDKIDQLAFERFVKCKNLSYDYTIADSVRSAKKVLESDKFETIIADYHLGDGDAIDILNMGIDAPIIITTGAGSEEIAVKAIKIGVYDYIIKDVERNYLNVLAATVDNAIISKQSRESLKKSEESYKDLYERVPIGLYRTEPGGRMLLANPKFLNMFGYGTFDEIAGVNAAEFFAGGEEERKKFLELVEQKGELRSHVFKLKKRGGGEITVRGSVKAMRGITGETLYYEGAIDDISEQIKADEILRMMHRAMESSLDGILITDPRLEDNPVIYCNPAFLRITGYEKDEIMFRNCGFLQGNDTDQDGIYQIRQALRKKIGCHVILRNYTKDGLLFWNELSLAPVFNSEGELINYVGIIKDITDRVKMDEEIIKRQKLDALSLLAGGIAHDLGNRLTTILLNVSLAQSVIESHETAHKLLANTEKACESVGALTQQLVAFSKGGDPVRTYISVPDIITSAMQFTPSSPGIEYRLDLPENLWTVNVDEEQMNRVISNIFWNAIQAMPGGGTIHISAENRETAPQTGLAYRPDRCSYVKVSIRDEGVGIPAHLLNKIFEPYFTTKKGGHGLGLAAAHSIIKNHGGHLNADSEPGKGTTFELLLPALPGIDKKHVIWRAGTAAAMKCGHILIMEDEPSIAIILKEMLERLGCAIDITRDGYEAIRVFGDRMDSAKPFDIVIMDLKIEGRLGGMEAAAMIRELDPGIKAVALCGKFEESFASNYEKHGFHALLEIPFTIEDLVRKLDRLL